MTLTEQQLSKLPGQVLGNLRRADRLWDTYKKGQVDATSVVDSSADTLHAVDWDVVICGGTLGILLGTALVKQGWRVALIERGQLRGRDQEWNISRKELQVLLSLDLLSPQELEEAIATSYNPARVAFHEGVELWVEDVLNIGIDPVQLLETLKRKFLAEGGHLYEQTAFKKATVYLNGVAIQIARSSHHHSTDTDVPNNNTTENRLTTRLLVDAMGHFSPITQQARQGKRPDAACLVVGTCANGYPAHDAEDRTGDLFASITPIQNQCQYFWEAFPARDGRTTYLFTYVDANPERLSLEELFEDYWKLLPTYQQCSLDDLSIKRALFGFFPCYRESPLQLPWNRCLAVGDSSGNQSPLSFGGFGAMLRHLSRLTTGTHEALSSDALMASSLALLQPYQPNVSVTWLFQKSMSVRLTPSLAIKQNQINALLSGVFEGMEQLGEPVLKPFLQDVVQFLPLTKTLVKTSIQFPRLGLGVIPHVGVWELLQWTKHYANLAIYSGLALTAQRLSPYLSFQSPLQRYRWNRWVEAWTYGSGRDYAKSHDHRTSQ
ncbi:MAG: FAD-binding oxidoreductase [Cyanobacteria bacterium P01_A01_bin.37]